MSVKYGYISILMSAIQVLYSTNETRLDYSVMQDWCDSLEAWKSVIHSHFCYTIHAEKLTWSAALNDCRTAGGELFKPDNQEKMVTVLTEELWTVWIAATERDGKAYWIDGTPVVGALWSSFINGLTNINSWFKTRTLCITLKSGFIEFGAMDYFWEKYSCSDEHRYVCEYDLRAAFKGVSIPVDVPVSTMANITHMQEERATTVASEIWTTPREHRTEPGVSQLRRPRNLKTEKKTISRLVMRGFLVKDEEVFEKKTYAATMCSRLCLHPCRVFNYNTKTGQCRGFASTQSKLIGVKNSAWDAWEIALA